MDEEKELLELVENPEEEQTEKEETPVEEVPEEQPEEETEEEPKADKVQKRFDQLTAKLKAEQEANKALREELAERRREIEEDQEAVTKAFDRQHAKTITYNGQPVYKLSQEEFEEAVTECLTNDELTRDERLQIVRDAKKIRKEYFETLEPVAQDTQKLSEDELKVWKSDWNMVRAEIIEINQGLEKHIAKIDEYMTQEFQRKPALIERLKRGPVEKFKYALKVMEALGIDHEIEKEDYAKERPAPALSGKGKNTPAGSSAKTFTREQIAKMSLSEFEKNEEAINKAMAANRIK